MCCQRLCPIYSSVDTEMFLSIGLRQRRRLFGTSPPRLPVLLSRCHHQSFRAPTRAATVTWLLSWRFGGHKCSRRNDIDRLCLDESGDDRIKTIVYIPYSRYLNHVIPLHCAVVTKMPRYGKIYLFKKMTCIYKITRA